MTTKIGGFIIPIMQRREEHGSSIEGGQQKKVPPGWQDGSTFEVRRPPRSPDANRDGVLDDSELAKMAEHISSRTGQSITAADLKAKLDENGDGTVTSEELRKARPERARPEMSSPDVDGDGTLSQAELEEMAKRISEITGQQVTADSLAASLDADGNGSVTVTEIEGKREQMKAELGSRMQAARLRR